MLTFLFVKQKFRFFLLVFLSILHSIMSLAIPLLLAFLIRSILEQKFSFSLFFLILYASLHIAKNLLSFITVLINSSYTRNLRTGLRLRIYDAIIERNPGEIFRQSDGFFSWFSRDVETIIRKTTAFFTLLSNLFVLLGCLGVMF